MIRDCEGITTWDSEHYFYGDVYASDYTNDIAALRTCRLKLPGVAKFRKGKPIRQGANVFTYGYPYTTELSSEAKITRGIVSSTRGFGDDVTLMQIDAAVQRGNSGGPIFDEFGNVVGIVRLKKQLELSEHTGKVVGDKTYVDLPQNVNFGIKTSIAINFLQSHNIEFGIGTAEGKIDGVEIADRAREFTVLVVCWK